MEFVLETKKGTVKFTSNHTDDEAVKQLKYLVCENKLTSPFAKSLAMAPKYSPKQMAWVHKLVVDVELEDSQTPAESANVATAPPAPPVGEFKSIVGMLDTASENLKKPAIVLHFPGHAVRLSLIRADHHSYPKHVWVASANYGGAFYGRIDRDGVFHPNKNLALGVPSALLDLLKSFAANPLEEAAKNGKLTGKCCFCNRTLTDEKSTEVGYGPVCAGKYGLAWGGKDAKPATIGSIKTATPLPEWSVNPVKPGVWTKTRTGFVASMSDLSAANMTMGTHIVLDDGKPVAWPMWTPVKCGTIDNETIGWKYTDGADVVYEIMND